jgi:hypothetical protein
LGSMPNSPVTSAGIVCGLTNNRMGQYNKDKNNFLKKDMGLMFTYKIFAIIHVKTK